MANWLNKIDISAEFAAANEDESATPALALAIAEKLRELPNYKDVIVEKELADLADAFEAFYASGSEDFDDFNFLMEELYDWADQSTYGGKVCWIATF